MKPKHRLLFAFISGVACAAPLLLAAPNALAWGTEGHMVVADIAVKYLHPDVLGKVNALLATDTSGLTDKTDIASESTWADKYRGTSEGSFTAKWHYVDTEIGGKDAGDIDKACYYYPSLGGKLASIGTPDDCVVNKVMQFSKELSDPTMDQPERLRALQFLLHFVGDMHQPLHASDDHDNGGNGKKVTYQNHDNKNNTLHNYWDNAAVSGLDGKDSDPETLAKKLSGQITDAELSDWQQGVPGGWSVGTFTVSRSETYGKLPEPVGGIYSLPKSYTDNAHLVAEEQLKKAGVRLAKVLNDALGSSATSDRP